MTARRVLYEDFSGRNPGPTAGQVADLLAALTPEERALPLVVGGNYNPEDVVFLHVDPEHVNYGPGKPATGAVVIVSMP